MREVYLALCGYQFHNQMGARSGIKAQEAHHGRSLMHEITILSTMGHALHLPGRSHASDLALYRDKSNALHSMKDVMHHRIQTQF